MLGTVRVFHTVRVRYIRVYSYGTTVRVWYGYLYHMGIQLPLFLGSGYRAGTGSSIFSLECRYHRVRPDYECFLQYTVSSGLRIFH